MGSWKAIALQRVGKQQIDRALNDLGIPWESAAHVTATTTLAGGIRKTGVLGLPIATLLDLVLLPGLPGEMGLPLDGFPNPPEDPSQGWTPYETEVHRWQDEASGRRLRIGIQVDDSLRGFVREEADNPIGRALVASRREYARTVHSLVAAGVRPSELRPRDGTAQLAARAWERAERDVPALGAPRELLWVDLEDLQSLETLEAKNLDSRVRRALDKAFGAASGRRTIVHHGFYFFTPPQWALFQVLRRMPDVDQVFVVHDDGQNPAFSTWRYYFRTEWGMPAPEKFASDAEPTEAAKALRGILTGDSAGDLDGVRVFECRSPAELVRLWRAETAGLSEEDPVPRRYAASAKDVERFVQRLGRSSDLPSPRLALLPVGSFLMSLHGCIGQSSDGTTTVRLTGEGLLDIVTSGYLDLGDSVPRVAPSTLRRALPYFWGCRTGEEWLDRAQLLRQTITDRVAPLGERTAGSSDVERIMAAAGNPTRTVPWADISVEDADALETTVARVVELVSEIAVRERVVLNDHLARIRVKLDRALRTLSAENRQVIEAKLNGFGVHLDDEIDVGGLIDVVTMLLGRTADFDTDDFGEDPESTAISQLRALDALGLARSDRDLHLTNLAEDVHPTTGQGVGWPFHLEDLRRSGDDAVDPITLELLSTRAATAPLGDLYLFWLALDGTAPGRSVTLSWVSESAGDRRRLSPIVQLITQPDVPSDAVRAQAGGLEIESVQRPADLPAVTMRPLAGSSPVDEEELVESVDALDPRAAASSVACPRRFAIQWAMGPTSAFEPEYLQSMLAGNVTNALLREGLLENVFEAQIIANDLWAHLTEGQLRSSLEKSVIKPSGKAADVAWLFTLKGTKNGSKPLDAAYQQAIEMMSPDEDQIAPADAEFLPEGTADPEVCARCPVQGRCSQRREPAR